MLNTSVNISEVNFFVFYCMNEIHVGFVWSFVAGSLCSLVGTPTHSWFLWNSLHAGWKIKPTQVFPLNLTALDLVFCIFLSVDTLNVLCIQNKSVTFMEYFMFGLCWSCRLLIQVCVCIEQYLAVIHPVTFLRYKGIKYRIESAAIAYLFSSGYGLLLVTGVFEFPDFFFLFICFIGVIVISFCCASVLCKLKHPGPGAREIAKHKGRDVGNQQKRNAFKTIFTVLITVLMSYFPFALISLFCLMKVDKTLMDCDIVPTLLSLNVYCVMCPSLLKLYKEGHQKCISNQ